MTSADEQARAVILALLMVVSVMGGSLAFGGVAAAEESNADLDGTVDGSQLSGTAQIEVDINDLEGSGTENDPYNITNASELQAMEDDLDAHYQLVADINASNTTQWNDGHGFDPVGDDPFNDSTPTAFNGSLEGNNHTITGLTVDRPNENLTGVFGVVVGPGTITNVSLKSYTVSGDRYVGGLTGVAGGITIENVTVSGDVKSTEYAGGVVGFTLGDTTLHRVAASGSVNGSSDVGGLVGFNGDNSTLRRVTASTSVDGVARVGGLVGQTRGTIRKATASGTVNGSIQVGGFAGRADNSSRIRDASASAAVDGSDQLAGGLVGSAVANSTIQNVSASGGVDAPVQAGGLIGGVFVSNTIQNANASGSVNGSDFVGGLIGSTSDDILIRNVAASGDVNGSDQVGGLVGATGNNTTVQNAAASGEVNASIYVGGFIGASGVNHTIQNAAAFGDVTGSDDVGGLVGFTSRNTTITTATASGDVNGSNRVGGLVAGIKDDSTIRNSSASGNVTGSEIVGGLAGNMDAESTIRNSSASGNVAGTTRFAGGLVGSAFDTATIRNSTASGAVIAPNATGGLVGILSGDAAIRNSAASGSVSGSDETGGLVGDMDFNSTIRNSTASGDVDGSVEVGGLVGAMDGDNNTLRDVGASGAVNGSREVGGLVGFLFGENVTVQRAVAIGDVNGSEDVGGLVGYNFDTTIGYAVAAGDTDGSETVGGLVGYNGENGTIGVAIAVGGVNGSTTVGGLVGRSRGTVQNVTASGAVNGSEDVGGLLGANGNSGTVRDTFAVGAVSGESRVGGLVGSNFGAVEDSYWDEQATGQTNATGQTTSAESAEGLTTAEMQASAAESNMTGLDFEDTWNTTESYPELRALPSPDGAELELVYAPGATGLTSSRFGDVRAFAEKIVVATPNKNNPVTIGDSNSRVFRIVQTNTTANDSVIVAPEEGVGTYDVTGVIFEIYDGQGNIGYPNPSADRGPALTLELASGSTVEVNATVSGERELFNRSRENSSLFDPYAVQLLSENDTQPSSESILAETTSAIHGIGYQADTSTPRQNSTDGRIKVSINREPSVNESWAVTYVISDPSKPGLLFNQSVANADANENFTTTFDSNELPNGQYTHGFVIRPASDSSPGESILGLLNQNLEINRSATITGSVQYNNGTAAAGANVTAVGGTDDGIIRTTQIDSSGEFELTVPEDVAYDLIFSQEDPVTDGVPDFYTFASTEVIESDTTVGSTTLPTGNVTTVNVTDENGNPVAEARVGIISHGTQPFGSDSPGDGVLTNEEGQLNVTGSEVELANNVTIAVRPPENSSGFVSDSEQYTTQRNITENTSVDVTLIRPPTVRVDAPETVKIGNPLVIDASNSSDAGSGIANYTFTFPNGETVTQSDPRLEVTAPDLGVQDITVTVTDKAGGQNSTTVTVEVVDTAPVIIAPPDTTYDPTRPFTIGTGHNATGVINSSDVAIRLVNVTDENDTQVALNDSVSEIGEVNTTIPAGALSGNVTIEAQLYNNSSQEAVANDTVRLIAQDESRVSTPEVNRTASSVSPTTATAGGSQTYTVTAVVENTSLNDTASGEITVRFREFNLSIDDDDLSGPEEELRIDYTEANVSDGTITVAGTVSGTAPSTAGTYPINVTDVEVQNDSGADDFLIEDARTTIGTVEVSTDSDDDTRDDDRESDNSTTDTKATFNETTPTLKDSELPSGAIRAEGTVADNVSVDLLQGSEFNYSLAIDGPDGAENVTFYLQTDAISNSQSIENLTMYLNGEQRAFEINNSAGDPDTSWAVFTIPQFSTQVISFTSDVELSDASVSDNSIQSGEEVTVNATLENTGGESATVSLNLTDNGTVVDTKEFTVAPDETKNVEFNLSLDDPGEHELGISGLSAGNVTVNESDTITTTEAEETSSQAPGFGPIVTLAALLSAAVLALRRRD